MDFIWPTYWSSLPCYLLWVFFVNGPFSFTYWLCSCRWERQTTWRYNTAFLHFMNLGFHSEKLCNYGSNCDREAFMKTFDIEWASCTFQLHVALCISTCLCSVRSCLTDSFQFTAITLDLLTYSTHSSIAYICFRLLRGNLIERLFSRIFKKTGFTISQWQQHHLSSECYPTCL